LTKPLISIIIIGRNAQRTLSLCLESVERINYRKEKLEVIYVDGCSRDLSLEIAEKYGINAIRLDTDRPSPGLGRNAGVMRAQGEFIQFLDADMEIDADWLNVAVPIAQEMGLACVVGRCLENPENKGFFNQVIGINWMLNPRGFVESPASGGFFRRDSLLDSGLYNVTLKANEEPELGERIRRQGGRILSVDQVMVVHNHPRTYVDYIKRSMRGGYARLQMFEQRRGNTHLNLLLSIIWHNLQVIVFLCSLIVGIATNDWRWSLLCCFLGAFLVIRTAFKTYKRLRTYRLSLIYGVDAHFSKVLSLMGQVKYIGEKFLRWIIR